MKEDQIFPAGEANSARLQCQTSPLRRILVVDDDVSMRQLSTEMLIRSGYEVDAAEDGASAWQALNNDSYDLLITDHKMPKVSGVELVKKIRSARMALPVILVSGTMPTEELNRHPHLQLAAMLLKPFTLEELLGTVKQVMRSTYGDLKQVEPPPNGRGQPSVAGLQL